VKRLVLVLLALVPGTAAAQLSPGRFYITPSAGAQFSRSEQLRNTATYSTPRPTDPDNPVVTDIKLDPGVFTGLRVGYGLTRRLAIELEGDFALAVCAIRQLELREDSDGLPQYETTTLDARIFQYGLNLTYFAGPWRRAHLSLTTGVGEHSMDLRPKGAVDPDPVRDRSLMAGLGLAIHSNDRLTVRAELRDFMYYFRFDNQFVEPVASRLILFRREEFLNTTSIAGNKFQNDLALTISFMVGFY